MRLLFSSFELAPLVQSGGLGDAVSGLARALGRRGHHVTCVLPAFRDVLHSPACPDLRESGALSVDVMHGRVHGRWLTGELFPGVSLALVDLPTLFDRHGIYGDGHGLFGDNPLRFMAFARASAYRVDVEKPDVLVAHDHHAALAITTLRVALDRGRNRGVGTVQVVHNNAYQGRVDASLLPMTGLPRELFHPEGLEAWGSLCLLKAGVEWADRIVAVSETYAREIQDAAMGEGLQGTYRARAHRLTGIPNGIDTVRFDPTSDPSIPAHFSKDRIDGKATCRRAVLDELGLDPPAPGLFCVAIGRFAEQKGWDVLARSTDALIELGCSLAYLGDGDPKIAGELHHQAARHRGRLVVRAGYDGALARRMYAGADVVLVPSRFEPCGLVQLIAQRYGAVPVAHATGGLVDTIVDPERDDARDERTGILFSPLSERELVRGVARVRAIADRGELPQLVARMMEKDVSWDAPASRWETLLADVVREARARL